MDDLRGSDGRTDEKVQEDDVCIRLELPDAVDEVQDHFTLGGDDETDGVGDIDFGLNNGTRLTNDARM